MGESISVQTAASPNFEKKLTKKIDYDDSGVRIVKLCAIDAHSSISTFIILRSPSFYSRISLGAKGH